MDLWTWLRACAKTFFRASWVQCSLGTAGHRSTKTQSHSIWNRQIDAISARRNNILFCFKHICQVSRFCHPIVESNRSTSGMHSKDTCSLSGFPSFFIASPSHAHLSNNLIRECSWGLDVKGIIACRAPFTLSRLVMCCQMIHMLHDPIIRSDSAPVSNKQHYSENLDRTTIFYNRR